ncbi:MAG: membrane dipeptidase [Armatimonadetes bacterium]|nr:membrane dipeptidase [Armatimonadota bacterium]
MGNGSADAGVAGAQAPKPVDVSARAEALHRRAILIDGHNDSLIEHWSGKVSLDLTRDWPDKHVDLRRMRAGGLTAMNSMVGDRNLVQGLELWAGMYEHTDGYPDDFLLVKTPDDILRAKQEGKIGLIGQLEACQLLHNSLRLLHVQHRLGARVAGVTHGEGGGEYDLQVTQSPFSACTLADRERARKEFGGLTEFGRAAVREMNRLGIVVDLAHCQDAAWYEAIDLSAAPVEFSHGNVFTLAHHWRNLTDDQLKALAANGGVIGLATVPQFVDDDPGKQNMRRFVDHIEYICERIGDDHVGFGADYDGMSEVPVIRSYVEMPQVTQLMLDRGFSEETILKFWGGNFLRVMRKVAAVARSGGGG